MRVGACGGLFRTTRRTGRTKRMPVDVFITGVWKPALGPVKYCCQASFVDASVADKYGPWRPAASPKYSDWPSRNLVIDVRLGESVVYAEPEGSLEGLTPGSTSTGGNWVGRGGSILLSSRVGFQLR